MWPFPRTGAGLPWCAVVGVSPDAGHDAGFRSHQGGTHDAEDHYAGDDWFKPEQNNCESDEERDEGEPSQKVVLDPHGRECSRPEREVRSTQSATAEGRRRHGGPVFRMSPDESVAICARVRRA